MSKKNHVQGKGYGEGSVKNIIDTFKRTEFYKVSFFKIHKNPWPWQTNKT